MKQHRRILISLLTLLPLLFFIGCSLPPYIHKLPLRLTKNYIYEADLYIGSDQQNVTVLVDTGSGTLAVFCTLCEQGCIVEQQFRIETSRTFQSIICSILQEIQTQSVISPSLRMCNGSCQRIGLDNDYQCKGQLSYGSSSLPSYLDYFLIRDQMSTEKNGFAVKSSFGCIYMQSNFDLGIWGLSVNPSNQFLDQIYEMDVNQNYVSAQKLFTICTSDSSAVMNIGGIDTSTHIGDGYVLRVDPQRSLWWSINTNDIGNIIYKSDNTVIHSAGDSFGTLGIILDSGTDFIILPSRIIIQITNIVDNLCRKTNCSRTTSYEIFQSSYIIDNHDEFFKGQFINFQIGGRYLETPLSNYFWNFGGKFWSLALVSQEQFHFPMSILGSIWMNNFDIVFDRVNYQITIHDITSCPLNGRNLQANNEEYDLPGVRGDRIDGDQAINRLKTKHQRNIKVMQEWVNI